MARTMFAILLQVGDVGNDDVDAEQFGFREHHARVDHQDVVPGAQGHHVHAEFAQSAERNSPQRRLAQLSHSSFLVETSYHAKSVHAPFPATTI